MPAEPRNLGIAEIFEAIDAILGLLRREHSYVQVSLELDRLLDLTGRYFQAKEQTLRDDVDTRRTAHCEVHRLLLDYISSLRNQTDQTESLQLLPQLRFLDYWLTSHITECDAVAS